MHDNVIHAIALDVMLSGKGYYRGSSILVSGTAGTGKSSMAAILADAACRRGERCLYFLFEESPSQFLRNMQSIGLNLEPWVKKGLLLFHAARPNLYGLEAHLMSMHQLSEQFSPSIVVVDPVTNLVTVGTVFDVKSMLTRLIDFFKMRQITTFFTSLTSADNIEEQTAVGISSLMDAWLMLRDHEVNGERNRLMYVLKARGMAHSNQVHEFRLTDHGIDLIDVYVGQGNVLTGTARMAQEMRDASDEKRQHEDLARKKRESLRKSEILRGQMAALQLQLEMEEADGTQLALLENELQQKQVDERQEMARARKANITAATAPSSRPGRATAKRRVKP